MGWWHGLGWKLSKVSVAIGHFEPNPHCHEVYVRSNLFLYRIKVLATKNDDFIFNRSPACILFQWMSDKQEIILVWPEYSVPRLMCLLSKFLPSYLPLSFSLQTWILKDIRHSAILSTERVMNSQYTQFTIYCFQLLIFSSLAIIN